MMPASFGCAEGVKVLGGADEDGLVDQRGRGQDLFVEFVLGQDRWGVSGGVHHGDDSFPGSEVNAAGGGDWRGPIVIGGVNAFFLVNGLAGFGVVGGNEAARFDREKAALVVDRGIAVGKAADAVPGDPIPAEAGANRAESAGGSIPVRLGPIFLA